MAFSTLQQLLVIYEMSDAPLASIPDVSPIISISEHFHILEYPESHVKSLKALSKGMAATWWRMLVAPPCPQLLRYRRPVNIMSRRAIVLVAVLATVLAAASAMPRGLFEREGRFGAPDASEASTDPLILTNYLHDPATAHKLSEVEGVGTAPSYSGFFTVNATYGSNMFFWYFPAQNKDPNAPLIMFLQGGPGASSMFGLFSEMGPYRVSANGKNLIPNPYTWNARFSMVRLSTPALCVFFSIDPSPRTRLSYFWLVFLPYLGTQGSLSERRSRGGFSPFFSLLF